MLLKKERHRFGDSVDERPELYLLERRRRESRSPLAKGGHLLTALEGEQGVSREQKTKVVAFSNPSLKIQKGSGSPLQHSRAKSSKFRAVFVRQEVSRENGVNSKPQVHHPPRGDNRALRRRDVVPQMHRSIQECVNGT